MLTFQEMLKKLAEFWELHGCIIQQGYDLEVGAAPRTRLHFFAAWVQSPIKLFISNHADVRQMAAMGRIQAACSIISNARSS